MKKLFVLLMGVSMFAVVACGPSKAEKEAAEKAKQDSIAKVEQARLDSIAAAEQAAAVAAAEQAKADSIAAAEEAAKNKKGVKPATTVKKDVKKEDPKTNQQQTIDKAKSKKKG